MTKPKHSTLPDLPQTSANEDLLIVEGARVHNLQSVSVRIPKRKLVVFTGPSGSGKSSLAFDTIYAEGRRRYVESMSIYARMFLGTAEKPDVDRLAGLSPAISIEQQTTVTNPRSTVGTVTEIYDHMRVLWAQLSVLKSEDNSSLTESQILSRLIELPEGTKYMLLAPLVQNRKGEFKDLLASLRKAGVARARIDGDISELESIEKLDLKKKHNIDVVVDRLVARPQARGRIEEALTNALSAGEGRVILLIPGEGAAQAHEEVFVRDQAQRSLSHQNFSFNSPVGWCPACRGIGTRPHLDPSLLILNPGLSLLDGALVPLGREPSREAKSFVLVQEVESIWDDLFEMQNEGLLDLATPWNQIEPTVQDLILNGKRGVFAGIIKLLAQLRRKSQRQAVKDMLDEFYIDTQCADCQGTRLNDEALKYTFAGKTIAEIGDLNLNAAYTFFDQAKLSGRDATIGEELVKEIASRLKFLVDVGLSYLTLNRGTATLSGGESQRMRLASQLGSDLSGVLYILDEPSIGLHQKDNDQLLETLQNLRDRGNSIIVVEHDRETMERADFLVDFGPGAGRNGGEIVASGKPEDVINTAGSITGDYLAGRRSLETPKKRRKGTGKKLSVKGATHHNLKSVDVEIPLGTFTCVTGVSGAGKSSLVNEIILPAVARHVFWKHRTVGAHESISGLENFDKIVEIDQSPIGRTPRSNPATYTKVFDLIRQVFSNLPDAKVYGFSPGRFSFNVAGGRCEECQGAGVKKVEMGFLADVWVPCDLCHGQRFNSTTLMVRYKGKSISDVLNMTVAEAAEFFAAQPKISRVLETLLDVGLDYIQLGQSSTTLSGGEAQRIKLSRELAKIATGNTLYILDEPSTGLHFDDIRRLLGVVDQLVEAGNTVLMIEHNLDIIKAADYVIDMGPDGGEAGGEVVAQGTPEQVARVAKSYTGKYLKDVL